MEQTSCDTYRCQREEQCDDCFLLDHLKECSGCQHYDHPIGLADTVLVTSKESMAKFGDVGKVVEFGDTGSRTVCVRYRDGALGWERPQDLFIVNR